MNPSVTDLDLVAKPMIQIVISCSDGSVWVKEAVKNYVESPEVANIVVVNRGSIDLVRSRLIDVSDPRVTVVSNPLTLGEGAAWKIALAHSEAPITVIHGVDSSSAPETLDRLCSHLVNGSADIVFGTANGGGSERAVGSFRSSLKDRMCTTTTNMMTNLNISDVLNSSIAIHTETLKDLTIEQDSTAVRSEFVAKVAAHQPTLRVIEIGIPASSAVHTSRKTNRGRTGSALWGAIRYSGFGRRITKWRAMQPNPVDNPDGALTNVLEDIAGMKAYPRWIVKLLTKGLGSTILEVGAGHGSITSVLAECGKVVAFDTSPVATDVLHRKFSSDNRVNVVDSLTAAQNIAPYESIILVNVLEHVDNEEALLATLRDMLTDNGAILIFAPAHPELYGQFDGLVGHYRRYRLGELAITMRNTELEIEELRYVNGVGAFAWLLNSRLMRSTEPSPLVAKIYDRTVTTLARFMDAFTGPPFGQSVVCIARKK